MSITCCYPQHLMQFELNLVTASSSTNCNIQLTEHDTCQGRLALATFLSFSRLKQVEGFCGRFRVEIITWTGAINCKHKGIRKCLHQSLPTASNVCRDIRPSFSNLNIFDHFHITACSDIKHNHLKSGQTNEYINIVLI